MVNILRSIFDYLSSAHAFELGGITILAGIGMFLASFPERDDMHKAQWWFAGAFLITLLRLSRLIVEQQTASGSSRYFLMFVVVGGLGVSWLGVHQWVEAKTQKLDAVTVERSNEVVKQLPGPAVIQELQPQAKTEQRIEITPIFKDSPLFTVERKKRITKDLNAFYRYLVGVGFDVPKEIPPLGVRAGGSPPTLSVERFGSAYEAELYVPEDWIDYTNEFVKLYATWFFASQFLAKSGTTNYERIDASFSAELIYVSYFVASFRNTFDQLPAGHWQNWVNALWAVRAELGINRTDKMMFYTLKRWRLPEAGMPFDRFFWDRIFGGLSVEDNKYQTDTEARVKRILEARGIRRPE